MATKTEKQINEDAPAGVESTTEVTPAEADKTSNAVPNDAKSNEPPVRTNRPDVPVAQVLVAGAGAHEGRDINKEIDGVAVDKDGIDRDGRFHGQP